MHHVFTIANVCPVQVGTFYETGGVDAVLVVEYAGVNPDPNLPQAGIHQQLLSSALRKLVQKAGFSVVRTLQLKPMHDLAFR